MAALLAAIHALLAENKAWGTRDGPGYERNMKESPLSYSIGKRLP
jgi:hypothetical protein